jgi:hypothetical protein
VAKQMGLGLFLAFDKTKTAETVVNLQHLYFYHQPSFLIVTASPGLPRTKQNSDSSAQIA